MNNTKNEMETAAVIMKLSMSGLPPFLQEMILDNIHKLPPESIGDLTEILDSISKTETDYYKSIDELKDYYQKLATRIEKKQMLAVQKIKEELIKELDRSK